MSACYLSASNYSLYVRILFVASYNLLYVRILSVRILSDSLTTYCLYVHIVLSVCPRTICMSASYYLSASLLILSRNPCRIPLQSRRRRQYQTYPPPSQPIHSPPNPPCHRLASPGNPPYLRPKSQPALTRLPTCTLLPPAPSSPSCITPIPKINASL